MVVHLKFSKIWALHDKSGNAGFNQEQIKPQFSLREVSAVMGILRLFRCFPQQLMTFRSEFELIIMV